jgi:hypothetical protein
VVVNPVCRSMLPAARHFFQQPLRLSDGYSQERVPVLESKSGSLTVSGASELGFGCSHLELIFYVGNMRGTGLLKRNDFGF